ncbi:MAG: hypothetical protein EOO24_10510 [Comamonadaceae bacterium]|nr:MAG: hypothetical protein EOO24_10510 [Comamonadaceae bacterium]
MKYLLVVAVVFIGVWLWRQGRIAEARERRRSTPPPTPPSAARLPPQAMVQCARCGVHLPASDALPGSSGGSYCTAAHRQLAEG